jgi:Arc/MetJ-type ribon-helix-helix transcriptional regulator
MPTTISIRFEDDFLKDIEAAMKGNRYFTKAEFVREAVRDKIKDLEGKSTHTIARDVWLQ